MALSMKAKRARDRERKTVKKKDGEGRILTQYPAMYLPTHIQKQVDRALRIPPPEVAEDAGGNAIGLVIHGKTKPHRPRFANKRDATGCLDPEYFIPVDTLSPEAAEALDLLRQGRAAA